MFRRPWRAGIPGPSLVCVARLLAWLGVLSGTAAGAETPERALARELLGASGVILSTDGRLLYHGMIAASGRLYIATRDGRLVCMGK